MEPKVTKETRVEGATEERRAFLVRRGNRGLPDIQAFQVIRVSRAGLATPAMRASQGRRVKTGKMGGMGCRGHPVAKATAAILVQPVRMVIPDSLVLQGRPAEMDSLAYLANPDSRGFLARRVKMGNLELQDHEARTDSLVPKGPRASQGPTDNLVLMDCLASLGNPVLKARRARMEKMGNLVERDSRVQRGHRAGTDSLELEGHEVRMDSLALKAHLVTPVLMESPALLVLLAQPGSLVLEGHLVRMDCLVLRGYLVNLAYLVNPARTENLVPTGSLAHEDSLVTTERTASGGNRGWTATLEFQAPPVRMVL